MTLEELKADYEAKRRALLAPAINSDADWAYWDDERMWLSSPDGVYADELRWKSYGRDRWDDEDVYPGTGQRGRAVYLAASVYLIARDHGLDQALLYKLSGGAIDPRVSA